MDNNYESKIIPIEENRLYFLFRRGKEEHIKALYENGEIYINTIDFIRKCDENEERSDEDDGINYRKFFGEATIKMCDVGDDIEKNGFTLKTDNLILKQDNEVKGNIYCLTGIYSTDLMGEREEIRHKTQSFGDSLILIYKPQIFLERIFSELQRLGYTNYKANKVFYYGNEYSGKVNFFRKHEKFEFQKEYRIFIPNKENKPIKLNIGNLSDIAKINIGVLKLTYTDEKEQLIYL